MSHSSTGNCMCWWQVCR